MRGIKGREWRVWEGIKDVLGGVQCVGHERKRKEREEYLYTY